MFFIFRILLIKKIFVSNEVVDDIFIKCPCTNKCTGNPRKLETLISLLLILRACNRTKHMEKDLMLNKLRTIFVSIEGLFIPSEKSVKSSNSMFLGLPGPGKQV